MGDKCRSVWSSSDSSDPGGRFYVGRASWSAKQWLCQIHFLKKSKMELFYLEIVCIEVWHVHMQIKCFWGKKYLTVGYCCKRQLSVWSFSFL